MAIVFKLPFSLRNQSIIESMSLLGISANDVNARPFQEFLKEEKNELPLTQN